MAMLRELMRQRHIAENMLATAGGERRLTDILHISELLQEAGTQLESEHAWCAGWRSKLPIRTVTRRASRCVLRVINTGANRHHSQVERPGVSAGLAAVYRQLSGAGSGFYHDRESFDAVLDLSKAESSVELAEAERPAEDLRLLYVALTRSVWHCSLGIAPLFRRRGEKAGETDFHLSALGRLIQLGEPKDAAGLRQCIETLCGNILPCISRRNPITVAGSCQNSRQPTCRPGRLREPLQTTGA